jgi:hypothetical protein
MSPDCEGPLLVSLMLLFPSGYWLKAFQALANTVTGHLKFGTGTRPVIRDGPREIDRPPLAGSPC